MGLRYRRSVKIGPVRINFSKSGVGYSVGNGFHRITKMANGRIRETYTIPKTGISYVKERGKKNRKRQNWSSPIYQDSKEIKVFALIMAACFGVAMSILWLSVGFFGKMLILASLQSSLNNPNLYNITLLKNLICT